MFDITERQSCRACNGPLAELLDLGVQALPDWDKHDPDWEKAPLQLMRCNWCTLLQLRHEVERERLFNQGYGYRSGISEEMVAELRDIHDAAVTYGKTQPGDTVIDTGSNDGTLMAFFELENVKTIGYEPSYMPHHADGPVVRDFFRYDPSLSPAKVITSIAMFYSVVDPKKFVNDVSMALHENGVWIVQMNDQQALLDNVAYDIIGHEHVCLWNLPAFQALIEPFGLEVFKVERRKINRGVVRYYVTWKGERQVGESVHHQQWVDDSAEIGNLPVKVKNHISAFRNLLKECKKEGGIHLYGASTRVSTFLQAAGIGRETVSAAAERSPHKYTFLVPGTDIPIISEEDSRNSKPAYYLMGIPFLDQAMEREQDFLAGGGKFIEITPTPRVL